MSAANETRGHSCGEHYPLTVTGSLRGWQVFNCKTGVESRAFLTYLDAFNHLLQRRV